jgi:hypothetical protein
VAAGLATQPAKAEPGKDWLESFVNHLGRTQDERKAAFKLRLPAAPTVMPRAAATTLSTMERG